MKNSHEIPSTSSLPLPCRLADWRLYAAAGATLVAVASTVEADIIYVDPANEPTRTLGSKGVNNPFAIDGINVSVLAFNNSTHQGLGLYALNVGNFFFTAGNTGRFTVATNFKTGSPIAGARMNSLGSMRFRTNGSGQHFGQFVTGQAGFAGFKLPANKGGGEGWVRVEVLSPNNNGHPDELRVIDWAYNDAGGSINAGQTTAAPEPSTNALALLAMGSAGVLAWRKRRSAAANRPDCTSTT